MSSETRQHVEELVVLAPWVGFIIAVAWFWLLEVRDAARASREHDGVRPGRSDRRIERGPNTMPNGRK